MSRQGSDDGPGPSTQAMRDVAALGEGPVDPEEISLMRDEYRKRKAIAMEYNQNPENVAYEQLNENQLSTNRIFRGVRTARDAQLDATIVALNSDTAQKLAKQARSEANAFNIDDFFEPLRALLGLNDLEADDVDMDEDGIAPRMRLGRLGDWNKVGWVAAKRTRRVMGVEFMYGPMAVEHKKRIINRRARVQVNQAEAVRPIAIEQADMIKNENETVKNVAMLETLLERSQDDPRIDCNDYGIPFFRWFINPHDFGQSVENLFYTSFLVREGKCAIEFDEADGEMRIMACEPPTKDDYENQLTKRQVVMELTMEVWKQAIQDYNITDSYIPHREQQKNTQPGKSGWY